MTKKRSSEILADKVWNF